MRSGLSGARSAKIDWRGIVGELAVGAAIFLIVVFATNDGLLPAVVIIAALVLLRIVMHRIRRS